MASFPTVLLILGLCGVSPASAQPLGPAAFTAREFQGLLQSFVDAQYGKGFATLGEEADFDHAHLLFDPRAPGRPVALLYHTQELGPGPGLDPKARNWLQWVGRGGIEDASRYERSEYPLGASWDWFQAVELPALRRRHTILDKMLDPARLAADPALTRQWVFTRADCARPASEPPLEIALPSGPRVCLSLGRS